MKDDIQEYDLVIGMGEIGRPLLEVLGRAYPVVGRDVDPVDLPGSVRVLHICIPFQVDAFVEIVVRYIADYRPDMTIIHSTVVPGTTRAIHEQSGTPVVHSPVRGKHTRMADDLMRYTKFVAGCNASETEFAARHLTGAGFQVRILQQSEALELAKLIETTYFGMLITWAQEVERFAAVVGAPYEDAMALTEEVSYFPPVIFQPGFIGGHCVIPNSYLLDQVRSSPLVEAMRHSNDEKREEWLQKGKGLTDRLAPKPCGA